MRGPQSPCAGCRCMPPKTYLAKLIRAGFKVAVCEQMEAPADARKRGGKSIVHRDVIRVVTPGTLTEEGLLDARGANRLAAIAVRGGQAAVASVELSTGEVECLATSVAGLSSALAALGPSEILVPDRLFVDEAISPGLEVRRRFRPAAASGPGGTGGLRGPAEAALWGGDARRVRGVVGRGDLRAWPDRRTLEQGPRPASFPAAFRRRAGPVKPTSRPSIRRRGPAWEIEKATSGSREGSLLAAA